MAALIQSRLLPPASLLAPPWDIAHLYAPAGPGGTGRWSSATPATARRSG